MPIEVKAWKTGVLRSLKQFQISHGNPLGIRISSLPLKLEDHVLSVPLYMISELSRLYAAALTEA